MDMQNFGMEETMGTVLTGLAVVFISLIIFGILYLLTIPLKNKRFIIILTAIYAFLTFYDLGSSKSPETFYEVTKNNKHLAVISSEKWNQLKQEYIALLKEGKQFTYEEEPVLNNSNSSDKILDGDSDNSINEVIELFGEIVEVE